MPLVSSTVEGLQILAPFSLFRDSSELPYFPYIQDEKPPDTEPCLLGALKLK